MSIDEIMEYVNALGGVLTLRPRPGDGTPEISWGDAFFCYAPDDVVPKSQPFATIVTKDYPDEPASGLDRPGAFRVNVSAGRAEFRAWTGREPRDPAARNPAEHDTDPATEDTVIPHPVYGELGWLAVVNPGPRTEEAVRELLRTAHHRARERHRRRSEAR